MRNEYTSPRVAKIAGKIAGIKMIFGEEGPPVMEVADLRTKTTITITWAEVRALAGSALTQTRDKAKKPTVRARRKPLK